MGKNATIYSLLTLYLLYYCDTYIIIVENKGGDKMTVGQRIKERRKELRMSADELGRRLGKDRSTVFRYENGFIEKLPLDILEPIAKALQTTPQYLMGWEEVKKNNNDIADIVVRLRTDNEFFEIVKQLNSLDPDKLSSLLAFLK
jgi:transcriptional regulator with XRE-family HTH domain